MHTPLSRLQLFEINIDQLGIDWESDGDRFMHILLDRLGTTASSTGNSYVQHLPTQEEPYWYHAYQVSSPELKSELIVTAPSETRRMFVGTEQNNDQVDPKQIEPWIDACRYAVSEMQNSIPNFEWTALVGPTGNMHGEDQFVQNAFTLGSLELSGATTSLEEWMPNFQHPSLYTRMGTRSFPLKVKGVSKGYNWNIANRIAAADLQSACALLTVAFGLNWRVREQPRPVQWGDLPIPSHSPWIPDNAHVEANIPPGQPVEAPTWLTAGWSAIIENRPVRQAFHSHHQGVALESIAPSHSLIAFVGSIEGIGTMGRKPDRCKCCSKCSMQTGATQRFREALSTAYDTEEAKELTKLVYGRRSKVAHEGALLGGEDLGARMAALEVFAPRNETDEFLFQALRRIKDASRRVLIHTVRNLEPQEVSSQPTSDITHSGDQTLQ